jgi:hypothetical protein
VQLPARAVCDRRRPHASATALGLGAAPCPIRLRLVRCCCAAPPWPVLLTMIFSSRFERRMTRPDLLLGGNWPRAPRRRQVLLCGGRGGPLPHTFAPSAGRLCGAAPHIPAQNELSVRIFSRGVCCQPWMSCRTRHCRCHLACRRSCVGALRLSRCGAIGLTYRFM